MKLLLQRKWNTIPTLKVAQSPQFKQEVLKHLKVLRHLRLEVLQLNHHLPNTQALHHTLPLSTAHQSLSMKPSTKCQFNQVFHLLKNHPHPLNQKANLHQSSRNHITLTQIVAPLNSRHQTLIYPLNLSKSQFPISLRVKNSSYDEYTLNLSIRWSHITRIIYFSKTSIACNY